MKNLFIDSNIWLSLYHFTNDDLVQFGKLKELNGTDIKLFVPQQVMMKLRGIVGQNSKRHLSNLKLDRFSFQFFARIMKNMSSFLMIIRASFNDIRPGKKRLIPT